MGIGTTETEGVDSNDQPAYRLQRAVFRHDIEIDLMKRNLRIEPLYADCRGDHAMGQTQQRLDQTGHPCRSFQVAQVAFDRSDPKRLVHVSVLADGFADGPGFERIADRRPGTMSRPERRPVMGPKEAT